MKKIFIFLLFFLFFANPCFALEITKFKDIYSKLIGAGGGKAVESAATVESGATSS